MVSVFAWFDDDSCAVVLRRKGHLKEQDHFIEFMLRMHETHTSLEVIGDFSYEYLY